MAPVLISWSFCFLLLAFHFCSAHPTTNDTLPKVDLGYQVYRATSLNSTGKFPLYSFDNIRYGQAPTGNLRFAPPVSPTGRNSTVVDGLQDVICPQAIPVWFPVTVEYLSALREGTDITNYTSKPFPTTLPATRPEIDPRTSEDCLFLDITVPQQIFHKKSSSGSPVIVWIHGGAFVLGSKGTGLSSGNPATVVSRGLEDGQEGVIFVSINYRLGLFGFLAGSDDLTPNLGLLDQRLALDWVQKNIRKFGGDPSRVTILGESAGGGSVLHHLTAFGGKGKVPFERAISQSGWFSPIIPRQATDTLNTVLGNASQIAKKPITSVSQLRDLPFEVLNNVNTDVVGLSPYALFTFGPVIGAPNSFVPGLPFQLLDEGKYHEVDLLIGHTTNEGFFRAPPFVQTNEQFVIFIESIYPYATTEVISEITSEVYPPIFDGSQNYTTQLQRSSLELADQALDCNAYWFSSKVPNAYSYLFSVPSTGTLPPGVQGQDIAFTFYNGEASGFLGPIDATVANALQKYLVNFAITGKPTARGYAPFVPYGANYTSANIGVANLGVQIFDPAAARERYCDYWLDAPYYS